MRANYLTDEALATLRGQLSENIPCYVSDDHDFFYDILDSIDGIRLDSKYEFPDFELDMSSDFATSDSRNVRVLYSAMRCLPPSVASDERLWAGFAHGLFWDYVQYRQEDQIATQNEQKIATSFFFTNGHKRSLYVNCLSRLWWTGHLTYDESNSDDPFALTDLITKNAFPSTIVLFSSSNMTANPQICLGVLDSIKKRELLGEVILRKHFVGPLRYLNSMGGITVLDVFSRTEIMQIVDEYLASDEFARMKLGTKGNAPSKSNSGNSQIDEIDDMNELDNVDDAAMLSLGDNGEPAKDEHPQESDSPNTRAANDPLIDDLEYYGYEYVDYRNVGGALWVADNGELDDFIEHWRDSLVVFKYRAIGTRALGKKPCWWTKDRAPE